MRKRIQKIVQEAIDETAQTISLPQNHFEFRGGTPEQKEGSSNIWIIRLLLGSKWTGAYRAQLEEWAKQPVRTVELKSLTGRALEVPYRGLDRRQIEYRKRVL